MKVNGNKPEPTFDKNWYFVKEMPQTVTKQVPQPSINERFELVDPSTFPNLKTVVPRVEAVIEEPSSDNDWRTIYAPDFEKVTSLYKTVSDPQPPIDEVVEFESEVIAELGKIPSKPLFRYEAQVPRSWDKLASVSNDKINDPWGVYHTIIDRITTPSILLHTKPVELTSLESYGIVRQYIKSHIDLDVARISSDYDFCFNVVKKVHLDKTEQYTVDINLFGTRGRKRKPKLVTKYRSNREVPIFEMTNAADKYNGYTVFPGFKGESHADLKRKVNKYLKDLMKIINEPLRDCDHCNGTGVKTFKKALIQK
jgi:hypothetical protein